MKRAARQTSFDMKLNTWHHLVAVFEASGKTSLYIDQQLVTSANLAVRCATGWNMGQEGASL